MFSRPFYFPSFFLLSLREGGFTSPHSSPGCVRGSSGVGGFFSLLLSPSTETTTVQRGSLSLFPLVGVGLPYCITSSSFESPEDDDDERESYIEGGGGE